MKTMDLDNLTDLSQMRDLFNVNEMVGADMDIFPNIFGSGMHMYTPDVFCQNSGVFKNVRKVCG